MTAPLRHAVEQTLPRTYPLSVRVVAQRMAQLAQADGSFRYGLRASKLADLLGVSLSTVKRAQAALVKDGWLERVRVGGGRASTMWRFVMARLRPSSPPETTRQPARADTGQERRQGLSPGIHTGRYRAARPATPPTPTPPRFARSAPGVALEDSSGFSEWQLLRQRFAQKQASRAGAARADE